MDNTPNPNIFHIKGTRPDGNIAIFDGCQNPYDVSLNNPPSGFSYNDKKDAVTKMGEIKNSFVEINWEIINLSQFIELRKDWCKNYLEHYK